MIIVLINALNRFYLLHLYLVFITNIPISLNEGARELIHNGSHGK